VPARKGQMAPLPSTKTMAYFVRSLELVLETSSHDWHVQPSCQRTESPSAWAARFQSSAEGTQMRPLPVLETCTSYPLLRSTVNPLCSQDFHCLCTFGPGTGRGFFGSVVIYATRNRIDFRSVVNSMKHNAFRARAQAEADNLVKDLKVRFLR